MKTKSPTKNRAIVAFALALLVVAFAAPSADARPPSKSPGISHLHKKSKAKSKACGSCCKATTCTSKQTKASPKRTRSPHFKGNRGAPTSRRGR